MAKLYFKYGAMGSSKSAQALITKFNYEERGMKVWLIKPAADSRDGVTKIKSRIGLEEDAVVVGSGDSIADMLEKRNAAERAQMDISEIVGGHGDELSAKRAETAGSANKYKDTTDVIIADECQFFTPGQIDELRDIVDEYDIPVLCFGLRTDFLTHLFPGSMRLFELADSITEIKTICGCGRKATVNARIYNGRVVTKGEQVFLGGNDSYLAMCHKCWVERIKKEAAG